MGPVRIHVLMMTTVQRCGFDHQHSQRQPGFLSFSPQHMWKVYTNFISPADFSSSSTNSLQRFQTKVDARRLNSSFKVRHESDSKRAERDPPQS